VRRDPTGPAAGPRDVAPRGGRRAGGDLAIVALLAVAAWVPAACSRQPAAPRRPPLPEGSAEKGGPAFLAPGSSVDVPARAASRPATVVAVRSSSREAFDRVVFELAGELPGYRVGWSAAPPHHCGSGALVESAGRAWLTVRLDPAAAHDEQGGVTVARESEGPGLQAVEGIVLTCDFEGVVSWALGAPARRPYRVLPMSDPPRLVVDVAHAADVP
jgi:hypothetical protein